MKQTFYQELQNRLEDEFYRTKKKERKIEKILIG